LDELFVLALFLIAGVTKKHSLAFPAKKAVECRNEVLDFTRAKFVRVG
jgi:hypothetical protein